MTPANSWRALPPVPRSYPYSSPFSASSPDAMLALGALVMKFTLTVAPGEDES